MDEERRGVAPAACDEPPPMPVCIDERDPLNPAVGVSSGVSATKPRGSDPNAARSGTSDGCIGEGASHSEPVVERAGEG